MRDVIIVGAGAGGPVVAAELAGRGLDVLLLEAGAHATRPADVWSHFEDDANNPLTGYFRFGPSARSERAWFRELPQNSFIWQSAGVGGTTLHYYGNCPRPYPGAFAGYDQPDKGAYDTAHLFPFTYRELVPYLEWIEAVLPVQTAALGTKEVVFLGGAETHGIPLQKTKDTVGFAYRPQENAILQPGGNAGLTTDSAQLRYPLATGCTMCGHCFQGCVQPIAAPRNLIAKRSTANSYVPMALTADAWAAQGEAITLIPDAYAVRVHTELSEGEPVATGVTWRLTRTGEYQREDARVVVLAGGCTENPRLWFNSGLPNPNDWVGRGCTDHDFDAVVGLFDRDTEASKGPGSSARCDFPGHGGLELVGLPPGLQGFALTFSDSGVPGHYTNGRGRRGPWDGPAGRLVGAELKEAFRNGINRMLMVGINTDDDVEADNRVTVSAFPADENGPVPRIRFRRRERSARTRANREFLAGQAAELLRGAGAKKVYRIDWAPILLHVQSSMRMGRSADDSVLDENAEARWLRRLFVADNSALPNSVGGANPTATTQALATRTAEKIFHKYFGGDPWIGRESPVVSTDPRISRALMERGL
jgi:choline dehydrogenase-like flavoprotein